MIKKLLIVIVMLSLLTTIVIGAEDQTTNLQEIEYKKLLLEQHAKTQAEFKQELAKRDALLEEKVVSMVNENFLALDKRIDGFIRKAVFKLGMAIFSAIVLGGSVLMLIRNQLTRKKAIKKTLTQPNEELTLSSGTLHAIKEQNEEVESLKEEEPQTTKKVSKRGRPKKKEEEVVIVPQEHTTFKNKTISPMGDER